MFQQAGMEPPQTYQELYEAGDRINEKFGKGRAISIAGPMLGIFFITGRSFFGLMEECWLMNKPRLPF